ncbi:7582_t:CDS:2 [Paraglomus occultum]|uniref:prephenate dehydratase n=1 Tax=Paraglomus occultum TaxID=144539 RepID=A0A9N9AB12_9GLOM|nr:7582_t:CDS:2 [Paraglomus occultum]
MSAVSSQEEISVAYLGPAGSYSQQAAQEIFVGDNLAYKPCASINDVFAAVKSRHTTCGIVPFENSTFGSVVTTLDCFIDSKLRISAEIYLPVDRTDIQANSLQVKSYIYNLSLTTTLKVHHSLLSKSKLSELKKVYSHRQALGQCEKWLATHLPGIALVEVASTSHAAELAKEDSDAAAIASLICAELYSLNVIEHNIEDGMNNTTRFFILGGPTSARTGDDKTYFLFTVDHRKPGALCDALKVFKDYEINLTKIDSRPSHKRPWHYVFFVEFQGHLEDENVRGALEKLKEICLDTKDLGSYPNKRPKEDM